MGLFGGRGRGKRYATLEMKHSPTLLAYGVFGSVVFRFLFNDVMALFSSLASITPQHACLVRGPSLAFLWLALLLLVLSYHRNHNSQEGITHEQSHRHLDGIS